MKTNTKITLLFITLSGFFVLFALGYLYIRAEEQRIYVESKQSSDIHVILTVLEFKMEGFLKPVKDNSAWDDMVINTNKKDTVWAKNNLNPILCTFNMSYLCIYNLNGEPVFAVHDTSSHGFSLSALQIHELVSEKGFGSSFMFQNGQLYEIFAAAIVPTFDIARHTKPNGYLIAAKTWNQAYCIEIEHATGFTTRIFTSDSVKSDPRLTDVEVIYHDLRGIKDNKIGVLKFQRVNQLANDLNTLSYFAVAGSIVLIIVCLVFFYWINLWVSTPLKQIVKSLSGGDIGSVKDILEKQNEFGEIARLIRRFNTQQSDLIKKIAEKDHADQQIKKLSTAVEQSANTIIITDLKGNIEYVNKRFTELSGYSSAEAIGRNPRMLKSGFQDDSFYKNLWETISTGNEWKGEIYNRKKNGDLFWESISIAPIKNNDGKMISFIAIKEDITDKKLIETALQKAKEEAERASMAKSEFLATMSHEIRTPMNGVIGMTELALTTQLTGSQRDYLETIQTSAYLLLDTINDILDFSKIEAGKLETEYIKFNLRDVLEKSVDILTVKAFEKDLELLCEIEPGLPTFFYGDPLRIRQILVNFISNAVKFTEKGEICISAGNKPGYTPTNGEFLIKFSVKDTGIGIEESAQQHIFNQFTQADNSTTRKYGGTGLGLSISKMLIEIMHGSLSVDSELGVGSTFSFELPLKHAPELTAANETTQPVIKRILVVDDNQTNLKIMKDMLSYWGIDSTVCTSGKEALDILQAAKDTRQIFDLVIVDMCMPDMDGVALAEKIRDNQNLNQKPLIFMYSSVERTSVIERSKDLGIEKYLTKPVKMKDFYDLLHQDKPPSQENPRHVVQAIEDIFTVEPGKTILIAEDNAINLKLLTVMLMKTGVRVIAAANGDEAIVQYKSQRPDLIFMDVHMPERDGFQTTKDIRKMETTGQHIPIIALTAIAMAGDREKCMEAGMDDYLSKPFRKDDLYAIIKKYLMGENRQST